jgi:hypothetical protein
MLHPTELRWSLIVVPCTLNIIPPPPPHRSFAVPFGKINIIKTSGFWPRVRARALRAPVFLDPLARQTGRCAPPPRPSQLRCSPKNIEISYFQKQNVFFQAQTRSARRQWRISFHWTIEASKYNIPRPSPYLSHPSKLRCTLLSIVAS